MFLKINIQSITIELLKYINKIMLYKLKILRLILDNLDIKYNY